ncbi:MAG: carboxypeptidase regulatory-like domain-containing protein [Chromatiaceae bacterium]|nr:MAG: carboxypeptidase regulatory-like domain-containing protein [Chromatiaceae bacterium]
MALVLAGLTAFAPLPALGHAALVEAEMVAAIRLHAQFDTGEPMAAAQVILYAPDNPAQAWARGTTDPAGRYLFAPDPAVPGRWTVQVRQAGHGAVAYIDVGADDGAAPVVAVAGGGGPTGPLQRAVMVALVAWGALGTALYFRRRRRVHAST